MPPEQRAAFPLDFMQSKNTAISYESQLVVNSEAECSIFNQTETLHVCMFTLTMCFFPLTRGLFSPGTLWRFQNKHSGHLLPELHTAGMESIQTPLNCSLFVSLQPFAKIKKVHFISHKCSLSTPPWKKQKCRNVCKCIKKEKLKYPMVISIQTKQWNKERTF